MEYAGTPFDSLSFDEKVLGDKLNMPFMENHWKPEPRASLERRVRDKMRESELVKQQVKREMQKIAAEKAAHAPVSNEVLINTPNPQHSSIEGMQQGPGIGGLEDMFDKRTLTILVFILAAFCIVQYLNQQQMANQLNCVMGDMCKMLKERVGNSPAPVPAPVPVAAPVVAET